MKRVFDDHGIWNPEVHASGLRVLPLLRQAFDVLRSDGYNPREAQALIESLVQEESLDRILEIKARLEQLRAGHAEAAKVAEGRHARNPQALDRPAGPTGERLLTNCPKGERVVFTPEHKARAFGLINPNTVDETGVAARTHLE